ncbi:DUF423 domain-containing protein [Aestuariivivens insulae]|uniref:DUF423 domain-containing protein n=1 Tax=Aestuariivivens insulae TaxID=1621988 RepID=UPI001F5680D2|nr:DUF423 domain-containing protein [Aestuariivivens insulae]
MRKRITYPFYLFFHNSIVVNGTLSKTDIENETNIEIYFRQHLLWKSVIFSSMISGLSILIAVISGVDYSGPFMFLTGTTILAIGIILWLTIYQKYERNIQEYKAMFSKILEI